MREFVNRTIFGALYVIVILACILSPYSLASLMLVVVTIGALEMCKLGEMRTHRRQMIFIISLIIAFYVLSALVALDVIPKRFLVVDLLFLMLPFIQALFSKKSSFPQIAASSYGSLFFLSLPASLMIFMYDESSVGELAGPKLMFFIFILVWVNDIFAYLTGTLFGKHKLFPRISPSKTIEGLIGGVFFTIVTVFIFCYLVQWMPILTGVAMTVVVAVFGVLGDLCESMIKRQAGKKDSGNVIPGHGGILDRFDSVLYVTPYLYVLLYLIK